MISNQSLRLLVTSGDGPAECRVAVSHVIGRIEQEAKETLVDCEVTTSAKEGKHGPSSSIVNLHGADGQALGSRWLGTIQWTAKSKIRPHHRRRNWFVGVFELQHGSSIIEKIDITDVRFETFRAGGPGGQHQNTTDSAVRATLVMTGLSVVARDQRSQHSNRKVALARLQQLLNSQHELENALHKALERSFHRQLERGNPTRSFKGPEFTEIP